MNNASLCKALEVLRKEDMIKLLSYLDHPPVERSQVRTNNHVERCYRVLRYLEKVCTQGVFVLKTRLDIRRRTVRTAFRTINHWLRYKWRQRKKIIRHILLQFAN